MKDLFQAPKSIEKGVDHGGAKAKRPFLKGAPEQLPSKGHKRSV